jgi:hypothetical protein
MYAIHSETFPETVRAALLLSMPEDNGHPVACDGCGRSTPIEDTTCSRSGRVYCDDCARWVTS